MQKVDLVIAGVGVIAVAATIIGVAVYDDVAGNQDIEFLVDDMALEPMGPDAADDTATFNWSTPDNATGAEFTVDVQWSGQSVDGGTVTVTVELHGPDGSAPVSETETFTLAPGSNGGGDLGSVEISATGWTDLPEEYTGDPATAADTHTTTWGQDIELVVTVSGPQGTLPIPAGGVSFTASAAGSVQLYSHHVVLPEVETA